MDCPLCNSDNTLIFFKVDKRIFGDRFSIAKCGACGVAWTHPLPDADEIASFYPEEYHGKGGKKRFNPLMEFVVKLTRGKRAAEINKLIGDTPGKVLDVGCGRGWMLWFMKQDGWEAYGTELSETSATFARETLGLNVQTKNVLDCLFDDESFDVVTLWHVLEHLNDPMPVLKEVQRVLKKDGVLIVEVPNFGGMQARLFGNKWFQLDSPRHLFHFN